MSLPFEILEHPAGVGFLAYGTTLQELFANAALAVLSLACEPETVREVEHRKIEAAGEDLEALLYAWLAKILEVMDVERLDLRRVAVTFLDEGRIRGTAHGERIEDARRGTRVKINSITHDQLVVEQMPDSWRARVFLDL